MEAVPDFKSMSTRQKLEYVWDYYRFHILGGIALLLAALSLIHHYMTLKTPVLDLLFLNAYSIENAQKPFDEFLTSNGYNLNDYEINVNTALSFVLEEDSYQQDYYAMQTLSVLFAAGDLDLFAAPQQIYNDLAAAGYTTDLRTIFTETELEALDDMIIYTTLAETGETFPSGLDLKGNRFLLENGFYTEGCCLAIAATTDSPELTKAMLLYIVNYSDL